jgi:hypothetical protein
MTSLVAIEILNELLALEKRNLLPRLKESTVFFTWASADEKRVVDRLTREQAEHESWLVGAINDLDGDPLPTWADIRSADIHYAEIHSLLPRLSRGAKELVAGYESAASEVAGNPVASQVVSRILQRTRAHADEIAGLAERVQAGA